MVCGGGGEVGDKMSVRVNKMLSFNILKHYHKEDGYKIKLS